MIKTILLSLTLLACSAWMVAQTTPSSSQSPDTTGSSSTAGQSGSMSNSSTGSGSETTIRGCLNSAGGSYTLTDAAGTTYQLEGDTSQLSAHVNNEVEIKGSESGSGSAMGSSASSGSSTGSSAGSHSFNVTKVKKVSSTCSTGASK